MDIKYKENSAFKLKQLVELYENIGWISYSNKPSELNEAIKNSLFNIGAFDGEELVGLIRVVGDNISIIYIQDILVKENYQRLGIGTNLLQLVLNRYNNVRQIILMTDNTEKTKLFYKRNGMVPFEKFNGVGFIKYNL
ncbi:GNAT family N-acetyltransferase [Clostridium paraputrificum]|uniref:GNAT family N-acetyltransferase n=1 Tax=Clostridium TaxID=1485 RepID=UPI000C07A719|nr:MULTISPECIES: GNAT family N-acetyltransferase [Clostridium]MDU3323839.1 GNAT family N-acetyltransferase [Escherichia coli]MDB2077066.1 GNAT family N-acetyltransferase [Clostridium paraputrificum]MDB2077406.1 GNAT family N-acetyltransferase [Clostridium paraputrificum]MDB2087466.1 GNAT family N-acetyltransferase [Clostridium paraputrificum]MDB2108478.1 GNAT family N-acetyltransferase [Clostridium paraputrificum]